MVDKNTPPPIFGWLLKYWQILIFFGTAVMFVSNVIATDKAQNTRITDVEKSVVELKEEMTRISNESNARYIDIQTQLTEINTLLRFIVPKDMLKGI